MAGRQPEPDLDALLDDALDGFDESAASLRSARAPADAPGNTPAQAALAAGPAAPARAAGGPKGLGFDPLARRAPPGRASTAPAAPPAAAGSAAAAAGGQADVDVLAEGLSQLLAELAKAEGEEKGDAGEAAERQPGGQQQHGQQQRDLAATLQALSEQAPSFAGGGGGGGGAEPSEEELLRLLAQHLGGLGGGADAQPASSSGGGATAAGGAEAAVPPGMASFVDGLMQQLLSKDVLYQPMKDIGDRYPSWLEANRASLSPEDLERYRLQHGYIARICALYEASPNDYPQLVDLLQQMQQCGQPPQEIVDELAPGMQFGPDGLPSFGGDEGLPPELKDCTIQ